MLAPQMTYDSSSTEPTLEGSEPDGWTTSEALEDLLVTPPQTGEDICPRCRGVRLDLELPLCENCLEADDELRVTCPQIIPITLYVKPSPLRDALTGYKDASRPIADREQDAALLKLIYAGFIAASGQRLLDALTPDVTCIVPSTIREPPHPFGAIVSEAPGLLGNPTDVLRRGAGPLGHRTFSERAYDVVVALTGRRVLLLDDVITTGSRVHCAAAAVARAGGSPVGALILARRYNPEYHSSIKTVWERQRACAFRFDSSGLEQS